ncbi:MAG: hypothetical protein ACKO0V_15660 [bacterium]
MLNANFKDMLLALNDSKTEYMVVGAYAMAAFGCPRATGDLDIWIGHSNKNAELAWKALLAFGAPLNNIEITDLASSDTVFQIGVRPERIDIITTIDGIEFSDAWRRHRVIDLGGLEVNVIDLDDLILNKQSTGRLKDSVDVELLKKIRK